jgi:hypothetical protein
VPGGAAKRIVMAARMLHGTCVCEDVGAAAGDEGHLVSAAVSFW